MRLKICFRVDEASRILGCVILSDWPHDGLHAIIAFVVNVNDFCSLARMLSPYV